jgi:magnesium transporter
MKFKLNRYLIDDIRNKEHPSDFEYADNYAILILRLPYIKNSDLSVVSYAFLIKENSVFLYDREKDEFENIGGFDKLYHFLDIRIDKILAKISRLNFQISSFEELFYDGEIPKDFIKIWLKLKKELSLIERLMGHSLIAFQRFLKFFKNELDELAFKDLEEHIDRAYRLSKASNEKLDYLFNLYKLKVDEKMNKIMFVLTIISAIFLPLTLATGFFGMNTGGLPLVDDPNGTIKVSIGVLLLEIPFIIFIYRLAKRD